MHPFDIKSVLLAKHAQHVILVHFPIALFLTGVAFDLAARRTNNAFTAAAARYNLVAAAITAPAVVLTGILAWRWALPGSRLAGVLLFHLVAGCSAGLLMAVVGWIHVRAGRCTRPLPRYRLPLEIVAAALVAIAAHLGGFLSGVNIP